MTVVIAGCGDLGTEVGLRFIERGFRVLGLRRSPQVLPHSFDRESVDLSVQVPDLPADTKIVVVATTASERSENAYKSAYYDVLSNVLAALDDRQVESVRVILVSSTAVYDVDDGSWVDESTPATASRPTAAILRRTEELLETSVANGTSLRLAGIYGPGRNRLINQVREMGWVDLVDSVYSNRIHRDDAAAAIVHLATMHEAPAKLYLGVDDQPVDLGEVKRFVATQMGIKLSRRESVAIRATTGKRCSNKRLRATGFTFTYPSYRSGYMALLQSSLERHR